MPLSRHLAPRSSILRHWWALTFQTETEIALLQHHCAIAAFACSEANSGECRSSHVRTLNGTHRTRTVINRFMQGCCSIVGFGVWCYARALREGAQCNTEEIDDDVVPVCEPVEVWPSVVLLPISGASTRRRLGFRIALSFTRRSEPLVSSHPILRSHILRSGKFFGRVWNRMWCS